MEKILNSTDDNHNEYSERNKKVKERMKKAKKSWVKFGKQINKNSNSNENQKLFYNVLKNMRTDKKPKTRIKEKRVNY